MAVIMISLTIPPQVRGEQIIIFGRKPCLAAANEPHLQKVDRECGIAVALHQPLRQEGLARMARTAFEDHHSSCAVHYACGLLPLDRLT